MSKTTTITCDHCNADITSTGSMPEYRLHLESEKLPHDFGDSNGGVVYSVMVYPPIPHDLYFCGIKCLKEYLKEK